MLMLRTFIIAAAAAWCVASCDEHDDAPTERDIKEILVIDQFTFEGGFVGFAELAAACDGAQTEQAITVTWSVYEAPVAGGRRPMGLGFAIQAGTPLEDCFRSAMLKRGAEPW